jgi:hypothetical protein
MSAPAAAAAGSTTSAMVAPPPTDTTTAISQFVQAETKVQQLKKESAEKDKALKEQRSKLRTDLQTYLEKSGVPCIPTGLMDDKGNPLYLRMESQSKPKVPTVERVTEVIQGVDLSLLQNVLATVLKKQAAAAKKNQNGKRPRKEGEPATAAAAASGLSSSSSSNSSNKAAKVAKGASAASASASSASAVPEDSLVVQVLKMALKQRVRVVHVTKTQVPAISKSQVRGAKLDPAVASKLWSTEMQDKVSEFRRLGLQLSHETKLRKVQVDQCHYTKSVQQAQVKAFLETHGDDNQSRKVELSNQKYVLKITKEDTVKPLTLPVVDEIINQSLVRTLNQLVKNSDSLTGGKIDWAAIWTPAFKAAVLQQVVKEVGDWKTTQRQVSTVVKMKRVANPRPPRDPNAAAAAGDDEEDGDGQAVPEDDDDDEQGSEAGSDNDGDA